MAAATSVAQRPIRRIAEPPLNWQGALPAADSISSEHDRLVDRHAAAPEGWNLERPKLTGDACAGWRPRGRTVDLRVADVAGASERDRHANVAERGSPGAAASGVARLAKRGH